MLQGRREARQAGDRRLDPDLGERRGLEGASAAFAKQPFELVGLSPALELFAAGFVGAYEDRVQHGVRSSWEGARTERLKRVQGRAHSRPRWPARSAGCGEAPASGPAPSSWGPSRPGGRARNR